MMYTIANLVEEFFAVIQFTNAPGTVANYRRHIDAWVKTVNNKTLDELRPIDLLRWGKTWHQIQAVQRLFGWAVDEAELVTRHPFRKVKKPSLGERKRTVTRKQFVSLCRSSEQSFRRFLLAMRETIARPQEIRGLHWEQLRCSKDQGSASGTVVDASMFFALEEYKARKRRKDPSKPRLILISKRLARLLTRLARGKRDLAGPIFLNLRGKPWTSNAVRLRMKRLRKRVGLKPDIRGEEVVAYSIRHTQATVAAAKGVRDKILSELMGHTSTRTTARYQHLETEHLRAHFERLSDK